MSEVRKVLYVVIAVLVMILAVLMACYFVLMWVFAYCVSADTPDGSKVAEIAPMPHPAYIPASVATAAESGDDRRVLYTSHTARHHRSLS